MTKYAEIDATGVVTKTFDNDGDTYTAAEGNFIVQSNTLQEGQRYEPVADNFGPTYLTLNPKDEPAKSGKGK